MEEKFTYKKPKVREIELDGKRIFISKSNLFGYKVVKPIKVDGKINWKNLITGGSWKNLIIIIIFVLILLGAINEYTQAIKLANDCLIEQDIISNILNKIFYNFTG